MSSSPVSDQHHKIASRFFDESVRISQIIWLSAVPETGCDQLEELVFEEAPAVVAELLNLPEKSVEIYANEDDIEGLMAALHGRRLGFLVRADTPSPLAFNSDKDGYSMSWGCYTSKWFYADALDEAFANRLIEWKESFIAEERAKQSSRLGKQKRSGAS